MAHRREFEIAFVGLKPGVHEYDYEIVDKFFEPFQQQDFRNCKADVKLHLDKKSSFMLLKFEIGGSLEVVCDRCNNYLPLQLWDEFNITVKMVEEPEVANEQEEDPDVYYISRGESHVDVANGSTTITSIPTQIMQFEKGFLLQSICHGCTKNWNPKKKARRKRKPDLKRIVNV